MSTCKFFLQGTCKFGDNCKFSHQINDTSQSASIMRQATKPPTIDTDLLIKSVRTDMTNAEQGGHWLLSSYAPFKDKPCFPGFENRSFEEVRWGYYEAMKNGTVEQFKQQLQVALQEAAMKMKALQNPSNDIISIIVQIYNAPVPIQSASLRSFSSQQPNTVFGQNQPQFNQNQQQTPSIFAMANQTLFGNTANQQQSTFANANTNIFGANSQQNGNKNVFGGQNLFTNQHTNNSLFGTQNAGSISNSPFGGQNTAKTQNLFGGENLNRQNSPFGGQIAISTQNSPFAGQNTISTQNTPFVGQSNLSTQNTPFGGQSNLSTQNTPFVGQNNLSTQNTPFGGQNPRSTQNNPFGGQSTLSTQNSPFGGQSTLSTQNSPFGGQTAITSQNSPFGGQTAITSQNSPFGGQAAITLQNSPFGGQTTITSQNSPFGGQSTISTQNSPFGTAQNSFTPQNNIFAKQNTFQTQNSGNPLFNNQGQSNNSIFSSQNQLPQSTTFVSATTSPFGLPVPQQQSVFGGNTLQQNTSPFQTQQQNSGNTFVTVPATSASLFGGQTSIFINQATTEQKTQNPIFGQNTMSNKLCAGANTEIDSEAYSKLEDLSESEIKSFQGDAFEFGKIPEKPPTFEMCN